MGGWASSLSCHPVRWGVPVGRAVAPGGVVHVMGWGQLWAVPGQTPHLSPQLSLRCSAGPAGHLCLR